MGGGYFIQCERREQWAVREPRNEEWNEEMNGLGRGEEGEAAHLPSHRPAHAKAHSSMRPTAHLIDGRDASTSSSASSVPRRGRLLLLPPPLLRQEDLSSLRDEADPACLPYVDLQHGEHLRRQQVRVDRRPSPARCGEGVAVVGVGVGVGVVGVGAAWRGRKALPLPQRTSRRTSRLLTGAEDEEAGDLIRREGSRGGRGRGRGRGGGSARRPSRRGRRGR